MYKGLNTIGLTVTILVIWSGLVGCGEKEPPMPSRMAGWSDTAITAARETCEEPLREALSNRGRDIHKASSICSCVINDKASYLYTADQFNEGWQDVASPVGTAIENILKECIAENGEQSHIQLIITPWGVFGRFPNAESIGDKLRRKNPPPTQAEPIRTVEHAPGEPSSTAPRPIDDRPYQPPEPVASPNIDSSKFTYEKDFEMYDPDSLAERELHDTSVRTSYLRRKVSESKGIKDTFDSVMTDKDQLIILGEEHWKGLDENVYPELLVQLKKRFPKIRYLFLEIPQELQKDLDLYFEGKGAFPDFSSLRSLSKLLENARKQGIHIYLVDPWSMRDPSIPSMKMRNEGMALEIGNILKKDKEGLGILITGKAHTHSPHFNEVLGAWEVPTQEILKRKYKVQSKVFNICQFDDKGVHMPSDLSQPFGFIPGKNAPVYRPRSSKIPTKVFSPLIGKFPYFSNTGKTNIPSREEYIKSLRPMYFSDSDAILFYNLSKPEPKAK